MNCSLKDSQLSTFYVAKWDDLRAQVDSALEILKAVGSESVESNIEQIYDWFVDVIHQMDMVEHRRNPARKLEAPRIAIVADDLGETSLLPHLPQTIFTRSDLQPEYMFVKKSLLEDPDLEVFKTEIWEELAARRKKQEELKVQIGNIIARQELMEAKQDEMSYDMKERVKLDCH